MKRNVLTSEYHYEYLPTPKAEECAHRKEYSESRNWEIKKKLEKRGQRKTTNEIEDLDYRVHKIGKQEYTSSRSTKAFHIF